MLTLPRLTPELSEPFALGCAALDACGAFVASSLLQVFAYVRDYETENERYDDSQLSYLSPI